LETQNSSLMELGNKIKALRANKKISQEELAFRAEIDVTHLQRIEHGKTNATYLTLMRITAALDEKLINLV
jgi:transcriptional regulator with XRE-family HTH domain